MASFQALKSRIRGKSIAGRKTAKKGEGVGKTQVPAHTTPLPAALFKANSNRKLFTNYIDNQARNQIAY